MKSKNKKKILRRVPQRRRTAKVLFAVCRRSGHTANRGFAVCRRSWHTAKEGPILIQFRPPDPTTCLPTLSHRAALTTPLSTRRRSRHAPRRRVRRRLAPPSRPPRLHAVAAPCRRAQRRSRSAAASQAPARAPSAQSFGPSSDRWTAALRCRATTAELGPAVTSLRPAPLPRPPLPPRPSRSAAGATPW